MLCIFIFEGGSAFLIIILRTSKNYNACETQFWKGQMKFVYYYQEAASESNHILGFCASPIL